MSTDKLSFFVSPRRNRYNSSDIVPMGHPMVQLMGHPMAYQIANHQIGGISHQIGGISHQMSVMAHMNPILVNPVKEYIRCAFVLLTENPTHDPNNKYQCIVRVNKGRVILSSENLSGRNPDHEISKLMQSFGVNKSMGKLTYLEHVENDARCITYKIGVLYIRKVSCTHLNLVAEKGYQLVRFNFRNYTYNTDLVTSNILHAISNLTYKLI